MNNQIWKFGPLYPGHKWVTIPLDEFAEIRHFRVQNGQLYFWAEVNPNQNTTMREFMVIPTGIDTPEYGAYQATVIADDGTVWHLYERI